MGGIRVKLAAAYRSKGKLKASVDHLMLARGVDCMSVLLSVMVKIMAMPLLI